jgi:cell division protein ZapA (FtsZ GTPase activity inhibitor)
MDVKKANILEYENQFADTLAVQVLDKPKLSLWMVLIPFIFIFYMYDLQKFKAGRKTFAEHYLVSRIRALDEAAEVVTRNKEPDILKLAGLSDVPVDIRGHQAEVLALLVNHYVILLRSDGEDYESLIRSAYRDQTNYLLFINRLNQAEKKRDSALQPHLQKTHEDIESVVNTIQQQSEKLRRESAQMIFT